MSVVFHEFFVAVRLRSRCVRPEVTNFLIGSNNGSSVKVTFSLSRASSAKSRKSAEPKDFGNPGFTTKREFPVYSGFHFRCSTLSTSIMAPVAIALPVVGWFVGPFMAKIINNLYDHYLGDLVGWLTGMKELESLRQNHPKIEAVVFAANQAQVISDQNPALNKWIWELRDALDEVNDVLDEFEYMKHKEQLTKSMEETEKRSASSSNLSFLFESSLKVCERGLKIDPMLKRLKEAVQKLDKVSAEVTNFLHLLNSAKVEEQEQQLELSDMQWLRKPSNEPREKRQMAHSRSLDLLLRV